VRFFYVAPRVVGVKLSLPPNVVGDGATAIADLVAAKNRARDARRLPGHKHLVVDDDVQAFLALAGRTLASVPAAGERVFLRAISNGAVGADSIAFADALHPSYVALVEAIGASLAPLQVAALDTVIADRAAPASPAGFAVLEVNNSPGVLPYLY
ncbi:hypothetical protein J8J27_22050, partial [Mycobacterium tuberculosis]|nr:hypothetical protein [Mycobacterium tuberculosis]